MRGGPHLPEAESAARDMNLTPVHQARALFRYVDIEQPPVDLEAILTRLGYETVVSSKTESCLVVRLGDRIHLHVNALWEEPLRRFAVAHLLGHVLLGHQFNCSGVVEPDERNHHMPNFEREANDFAAELLIPRTVLEARFKEYAANREHRLTLLAGDFGVPPAAIRSRCGKLGLK